MPDRNNAPLGAQDISAVSVTRSAKGIACHLCDAPPGSACVARNGFARPHCHPARIAAAKALLGAA